MSWISSIAAQHYRHPNHWAVWATSTRKLMHLQPAQARAQPMEGRGVRTPQFLLTPIFGQAFPFHHTPGVTIWSLKFQRIPREGLTEPSPVTPPSLFLGLCPLFGLRPQISGASRPWFGLRLNSPNFWSVVAPLCSRIHMPHTLRLRQYLLLNWIEIELKLVLVMRLSCNRRKSAVQLFIS